MGFWYVSYVIAFQQPFGNPFPSVFVLIAESCSLAALLSVDVEPLGNLPVYLSGSPVGFSARCLGFHCVLPCVVGRSPDCSFSALLASPRQQSKSLYCHVPGSCSVRGKLQRTSVTKCFGSPRWKVPRGAGHCYVPALCDCQCSWDGSCGLR